MMSHSPHTPHCLPVWGSGRLEGPPTVPTFIPPQLWDYFPFQVMSVGVSDDLDEVGRKEKEIYHFIPTSTTHV